MKRLAVMVLSAALTAPALAAPPLRIKRAHAYSDRVIVPYVEKEAEKFIVPKAKTEHCWQITSRIVGCRVSVKGPFFKNTTERANCIQIATIMYRPHSTSLRWKDSDSYCWTT